MGGQAFKQISPSFFPNPSSLNIHRIEVVYASVREWRLTKCKSLFGQGCHYRYFWFSLLFFVVQAVINDLSNELFLSWDPELADAQEPVCVPFLLGSVCFEGLEPATWTKDLLVKGLLGALPQRVSELCPGGHQLLQFLLLGLGEREEVGFYSTVPNLLEQFSLSYLAQGE